MQRFKILKLFQVIPELVEETSKPVEEVPNSGGSLTSSESFNNFLYWKDPIPGNDFNFTGKKFWQKNNNYQNNKLWLYIFRAEIPISATAIANTMNTTLKPSILGPKI